MTHTHRWLYEYDAAINIGGHYSYHRAEWCAECGTLRVNFSLGWAYHYPTGVKEMLEKMDSVKEEFVTPQHVPPQRGPQRLGRGLAELRLMPGPSPTKGLLPKPKE